MTETLEPARSIAWLVALVGGSALLMAIWFFKYPHAALICTLVGVLACMAARWSLGRTPAPDTAQAESREP